ncbi:MFS transporter [Gymnodinialimonas ulvae]|uniref:MFS transporter n=1 Tax=Gymnodinialimonas ulvae TaxID=3126504 RepID=UPI0030B4743E
MAEQHLSQLHPKAIDIRRITIGHALPSAVILGPIAAYIGFVMDLTLVPLLLPAIKLQFGLSVADLAWVFNSYGAAVAVGVLVCGYFGDTLNIRKIFGLGVALFATGALISATAQNYETLIAGRLLQGFGAGIFSPLVPIYLTRASPDTPGRALILWGSVAGYIAAFTPFIYGNLLGDDSWRIAFVLIAAFAAGAWVLLIRSHVPQNPEPSTSCKRNYSEILRSRDLLMTFAYVFCTYGSITYYLFRLPVWLSENEIGASSIGLYLSVAWLTFSCISTLLRNLVDRPHIQGIMLVAPLLIAVAMLLLSNHQSFLLIGLSSVLIGAGLACSNAPSTQLILRFAPEGLTAVSASMDITFARIGGIATVSILAWVDGGYARLAICILCLLAAVCAYSVTRSRDGTG